MYLFFSIFQYLRYISLLVIPVCNAVINYSYYEYLYMYNLFECIYVAKSFRYNKEKEAYYEREQIIPLRTCYRSLLK